METNHAGERRALGGPAWRSKLVQQLPRRRSHRLVRASDEPVRRLHHCRQLCRNGKTGIEQAEALYPDIAAAERLHKSDRTDSLKIAVLGGLESKEIARRFSLDEAVIEAWEQIYFDVRGMREAVGWIHTHVIQAEQSAGRAELAARLKFVAAVGPVSARVTLDADTRVPLGEGQRLFDRRLKLHFKFDAAAEMRVDSDREKLRFMRMYLDLAMQEKRLDLQERKLTQRCREAIDKTRTDKMRLELAKQRAERKAAAEKRRETERQLIREAKAKQIEVDNAWRSAVQAAEAQAATARATASPLAQLKWNKQGRDHHLSVELVRPLICHSQNVEVSSSFATPDMYLLIADESCDDVTFMGDESLVESEESVVVAA